jgi:DNA-binding SARP family transcriptional activator
MSDDKDYDKILEVSQQLDAAYAETDRQIARAICEKLTRLLATEPWTRDTVDQMLALLHEEDENEILRQAALNHRGQP